ncbi:hypothetical protein PCYB_127240 [Plasmodium cynomolgi strain B]|uniref:Uncharacterized protein n=1 Tax=Plasmodium cynomolgi (strain B) TaxID=1120755 RepID=K6UWU5_PLACD|nr:hypothetical protein PCYB_127240 [Plasmodium cynomolgi strain B]GAB68159.1 hypothetical protein PCYB_127240 [Plasmodium cynomolgi strain B]
MLIQKFFSLVPAEDKKLENLVNELAQSKKNIKKIQNYGAKERSADSSIHKDDVNQKVEKLVITSAGSRRNESEKDKWCSFRQKKNNAKKGSPSLSQKYKKTTFDFSKDSKAIKWDPPTSDKFDLSSVKENELFQRIFKTVERENIKSKNEKLKSKSEKLKHLKNNLGNQNEHVKSKNVNEENKDQQTELISKFRKVLSDKKKTYATLKIRTRSFGKEHASFSPFPDNAVECYNMHYSRKGESCKNGLWGEVDEKTEEREKRKEHTKIQRMEHPYQNGQDRIAKGTAHRSSHNQKGCSSSKINQNDLINAERGNTSHYFTKRCNAPRQKGHRNEDTYRQFENRSVMEEETSLKGKKLPPNWEAKSSRSSSSGNKSQGQYYIRSCSSNFSVPSSNNYKKCKNSLSAAKQKDKMCEQVNDDRRGRRGRKDNHGKKKEKKSANTRDNKLCNHKNKRSHTCRYIFRNAYTLPRRVSKYKSLHRRLHLIDDPMGGHHFPKCDNSFGKKFQFLVVKKKRKKINMTIFAKTKIEKHMHATSGGIHTLQEKSPNSRSEYANSVKEDCHSYSPIRSIEHTRENSNGCKGDQFYHNMVTSCESELKNHEDNSNNEDEKNSSHFKENNKSSLAEKGLHNMSDYGIFPHNNSDTHRDRLSTNGKEGDQMHEMKAKVCALKDEDKAQNTCIDSKRWKNMGESKIKIQDRIIEKERISFNCAPKKEANLNNSNGEIADLLSHATGNTISRSNTTSNTPYERVLGGDFDEPTEKLRRGNNSIMGHSIVAERGTDDLWKNSNPVKLNRKGSELPHKGENIELGKQRKKGSANCISTDLHDDTHSDVHTDQQGNNHGKEHILQEILSFYTRYKNKLNFLLQEEYNYLCRLRDYVRKNAQESEEVKNGDSAKGTSTHECCERDNVLINELVHQINNCISEKNKLHNSCDEEEVSTNQIKKRDCRKGKENFMYHLYKDDADVHKICVQTNKRIKRIEYYLNQSEKKCLGKNNSITKREAPPFVKSSSSDRSSNKSELFCKDSSVESNKPDCPFRRADMTNLRNRGEEMNHMRLRKRNSPSWRGSIMTKRRMSKKDSICAAMNKKVLVRKKGSFEKGHCSKTHFKYELLYRIKVSKYLLHNWTKLGGHYSASSNYLLRSLKCAAANGFHLYDKNELHFKGSLCLFNYKPCLHHFKANTFYCYFLCEKERGNFRKRLSNAPNRAIDPIYEHAQNFDQRECSNYLNCTDGYKVGKNNKTYWNVPRDRENKERKIFTLPTPICEHNFLVTRTNSNCSHISCSPFCGGESLTYTDFTGSMMKHAINSIPCSGGKYITKKESDSFASTNLRWNQKSTPDLCGTTWRGKRNTEEGATCESSTHRMTNSKWATSTSSYITQTGGKNKPLKNDTPTSSSLHHVNINLNPANVCYVSPNLLSDKDKREQLYDNTEGRKGCMQSLNSIKSLGIKNGSTLNGKLICEQNYPFEKHLTRLSHHIGGSKKKNFASTNENNYLTNSIPVEQLSAHFNVSDKCRSGGENAEWLSFPNGGCTTEYPPRSECYINVYENNCDTNDSLEKRKNMYQLNCSYDNIVNSLCTSRGKIAQGNVGTNKNCKKEGKYKKGEKYKKEEKHKKEEKYKKQSNVINDEEGQNGNDNLSKLLVDNFNEVREHNRDSNTPSRRNDKCQLVPQVGNNIPRENFNVNKSDCSATADAMEKHYVDLLTNGDNHSRYIGAKLKKKKQKTNNIPHAERDENENTPIQNVHWFEKEKKKGNSPEKELTQGETHATQMHHIGRDRKGVGAAICSARSGQQNGQLSPPSDATNCNYKRENHDLDKNFNFEKRESYDFFDNEVDTFDRVMREENSKPLNTHRGVSQNEIKAKWQELKRGDYNPEEYSNFTNSLNGKREENYFFTSCNEKHNLRKLKYDISEHIYGDTPLNWNPSSSTPQKGTIHAKEYTTQKEDSPRMVKHGERGSVLMSDDNTVKTEYNEKINDHFNQSHFSDFYNSNSFSQSFNFTDQDWAVRGNSNCDSISQNFINTNKLDQIIEKIKKWNEQISNDVNYIQCLFCDKYLFKVENHHDMDILNSSINESIRREKYTCAICKHKIKTLSKYNDEVKIGEQVDTQKGEYFEGKLMDGKKYISHNAEGVVDFLKTEKLENSLDITCSGSNKIPTSIPTDASLSSDVLKKGAYHSGRKSESGNALRENCPFAANCGIDDPPQFAKGGPEKQAHSFHNRNLSYPRGFAIFDDTAGNGPRGSNMDSGLFHFEEVHPKSGRDSDSGEAIDSKSTGSSGENLMHTCSVDNEMTIQERGKFDQMDATEGRQFEHTHGDEDDNDDEDDNEDEDANEDDDADEQGDAERGGVTYKKGQNRW